MKKLIIIILSIIFFIGSSKKELMNQKKEEEISKPDSLSNYFLFDYIQSLTAEDYTVKLDSIKNGESNDFFTLRMSFLMETRADKRCWGVCFCQKSRSHCSAASKACRSACILPCHQQNPGIILRMVQSDRTNTIHQSMTLVMSYLL